MDPTSSSPNSSTATRPTSSIARSLVPSPTTATVAAGIGDEYMQEERARAIQPLLPSWSSALTDQSGGTFGEVVTPDIRLEGSIFATPIDGRENVWKSLRAAAAITDGLSFTHESTASDRSYLEWELEALGGHF